MQKAKKDQGQVHLEVIHLQNIQDLEYWRIAEYVVDN